MANKQLFGKQARNAEMAPAYAFSARHALAQYAATGCFGQTFYASAKEQLTQVLALCASVPVEFVAKTAIYSRQRAFLKDMPALLCAWLSSRDAKLHETVFWQVMDDLKMVRTYIQILRSGVTGRASLGSGPKRLVNAWLASRSVESLFRASAGQHPSLRDVLQLAHPRPADSTREAFYGYLLGRDTELARLPELVRAYELFEAGESLEVPNLPLPLLTSLPLSRNDWKVVAERASWQTLRMNLNTFARHGVFEDSALTARLAAKLGNADEVRRSRVFPYQLLMALRNTDGPEEISAALEAALEVATEHVPALRGRVVVCPDVSGSMSSPVTGHVTTRVRCVDAAALLTAAIVRKNPDAIVLPFERSVVPMELNPRASVMQNADRLSAVCGGGTNCSAPVQWLNKRYKEADVVILISDNESWADPRVDRGTALMNVWERFRLFNPKARLVCLDMQPNMTTQAPDRSEILNIGGFSDNVFSVISAFAADEMEPGYWVSQIEAA